jgi:hypothetical protein
MIIAAAIMASIMEMIMATMTRKESFLSDLFD